MSLLDLVRDYCVLYDEVVAAGRLSPPSHATALARLVDVSVTMRTVLPDLAWTTGFKEELRPHLAIHLMRSVSDGLTFTLARDPSEYVHLMPRAADVGAALRQKPLAQFVAAWAKPRSDDQRSMSDFLERVHHGSAPATPE